MIDWQSNYTVDWKIVKINEDTWDDQEDLPGVLTVTISRDCTDSVPLLETSSLEVYTEIMDEFRKELDKFTHKDQNARWMGGGLNSNG